MYDNTVIAIYGDHQGMNKETPSVQWKMTDFLGKEYDYDADAECSVHHSYSRIK